MRIPLDYYRILGLPIQATAEQLQQAHRDRTLQLPRREYSEVAIAARRQLLDEAYAVLSDPEQRQAYDASFLAKTYELDPNEVRGRDQQENQDDTLSAIASTDDPYAPTIEIPDKQFSGALLILQELGEYELVLKLGRPFLGSGNISLRTGRFGDPALVLPDIVLTVALAYLELGREQWQQNQFEKAAESLESGQELLLREGIFPKVRGEMQADLYKLRPYRILELLALPVVNVIPRLRGLQLLKDMIHERGGIDGSADDRSGLSVDDFLRFIQQIRTYLTAAEQQELFEAEARRPSAVATYLAVYALVARGFAQRQPALVRRAKLMLMQLGRRQDVNLELAVCSLLLGQTEEASQSLELSQEYEPLAFIREHSQASPDLLPGLCLYGERWLQEEVFPHFRDLANQKVSLKDYFADTTVQAYLEALPAEEEGANEWVALSSGRSPVGLPPTSEREPAVTGTSRSNSAGFSTSALLSSLPATPSQPPEPQSSRHSGTAAAERDIPRGESSATPPRLSPGSRGEESTRIQVANRVRGSEAEEPSSRRSRSPSRRRPSPVTTLKIERLVLLVGAGLLALILLWALLSAIGKALWGGPALTGEQLSIPLDRPVVVIPDPQAQNVDATGPLTEAVAKRAIEQWLAAKAAALGPEHNAEQLQQVLVDPSLSQWQRRAAEAERDNWYWQYKHQVDVLKVETNDANADLGKVEAQVREEADFYERGQLNRGYSYSDNLRVRYDLIRQQGQWRIQDITVLR